MMPSKQETTNEIPVVMQRDHQRPRVKSAAPELHPAQDSMLGLQLSVSTTPTAPKQLSSNMNWTPPNSNYS